VKSFRRFFRRSLPALALLVCGSLHAEVIDRILVKVNSRIITASQFEARTEAAIQDAGQTPTNQLIGEIRKKVMEEMVSEALIEDRARDLDLVTTDADVEEQIKRLKEQNNVSSDEEFEKALAASNLSVEKLREQLKKTLTVQRVLGREVNSKVDLSDDALRIIYEREKETWRVPEQAHLAEVLISAEGAGGEAGAARRAREASDKIKAGAKFEDVVREYSDSSTKSRGGDLGKVTRGDLNPEIDRVVFSLPSGSVSDPIKTKFGWHLVKVIEKMAATHRPFNEVKADLLKREQETQFQKKLAEYLEKLKGDSLIRVSEEASGYYTAPPPPPAPAPAPVPAKKKKT